MSSDSSDVVQDVSDIGIDTASSSSEVGVRDALDDVVVEGAISLSRVRRAGSLAGGTPGEDFPVFNSIPRTNFNCDDKGLGYYADVDTGCQVREWPSSRLGGGGLCQKGKGVGTQERDEGGLQLRCSSRRRDS